MKYPYRTGQAIFGVAFVVALVTFSVHVYDLTPVAAASATDLTPMAISQAPQPDERAPVSTQTLSAASMNSKAAELLIKARSLPSGVASETLLKRPESNIQMAVRVKSGQAEWHRDDADILIGVEGRAEIVTGGEIVGGKPTSDAEIRGTDIQGGTKQPFGPGDYVRIEARVPHRMVLAPGSTVRYMAVKVSAAPSR